MRQLLAVLLLYALQMPVVAMAQSADAKRPKDLQPLPELPEPPVVPPSATDPGAEDPSAEPQVTIVRRGEDTVEEYRLNGQLYMIKVTPRIGLPYYLTDNRGDGTFSIRENHDQRIRPPMWVIFRF